MYDNLLKHDEKVIKKINEYRKMCRLDESIPITEDNLSEYALSHLCVMHNYNYDQTRCELLGKQWKGYNANEC